MNRLRSSPVPWWVWVLLGAALGAGMIFLIFHDAPFWVVAVYDVACMLGIIALTDR